MIILHNQHDKTSRDFVAAHGAGHTVVDWYDAERSAYEGPHPSAFPSVVDMGAEGGPVIVRLPVDMADAEAQIAAEIARRQAPPPEEPTE
jgi:hypothetical protein